MRNLVKWIGLVGLAGSTVLGVACTATGGRNVFGDGGSGGEDGSSGNANGGMGGTAQGGTAGSNADVAAADVAAALGLEPEMFERMLTPVPQAGFAQGPDEPTPVPEP